MLGLTLFAAYLAKVNNWLGNMPDTVFETLDLSFAFIAILYGATSLHLSLRKEDSKGVIVGVIIAACAICIFAYLFTLNYWVQLGLPVQS